MTNADSRTVTPGAKTPGSKSRKRSSSRRPGADSPMMVQYNTLKAQQPDRILFFRMGDFYEMFYDDAVTASRVLGLTLTSRQKGADGIPMAGIPVVAATGYIAKLLAGGYSVAVAEQVENPATAKGIVDRRVVEVVTPGTLVDERLLSSEASNFLMAACADRAGSIGLAWLDLSTGRFRLSEVEGDPARLCDEAARIGPSECLLPEPPGNATTTDSQTAAMAALANAVTERPGAVTTTLPTHVFSSADGRRRLLSVLKVASLEGFDCEDLQPALGAAGAVLRYVEDTNSSFLDTIHRVERHDGESHVRLDRATLRGLEVLESSRDRDRRYSLLGTMDRTSTPPGARLLREWLAAPLRQAAPIRARHGVVAMLVDQPRTLETLREALNGVGDIERQAMRLAGGRGSPRDLATLRAGLGRLPRVKAAIQPSEGMGQSPELLDQLHTRLDTLHDLLNSLETQVVDDPPSNMTSGGIIRDGISEELDSARCLAREGRASVARLQEQEIAKTGISNLKVGYNRVFGYYIEVTNSNRSKVPPEWVRRQTLKNAERYVTEDLKEFESKVLTARERAQAIEERLFHELRQAIGTSLPRLQQTATAVAELDVLSAFAAVARERSYCRPQVDHGDCLEIMDGRHPVLDAAADGGERFVGNDVSLGGESAPLVGLIMGPNMAGKSTYIRQTALLALLAQAGSFIPAQSAHIGICDRIFARIGASDDLTRGLSTFMVEMTEAALILNHATHHSLVVLDEVGRGTSTYDGVAIAWALAEHLHNSIGARTLFATHYHELAELEQHLPRIRCFNVAVREWQNEIVFLRKVVPGSADRSYGVHVARLAGVPSTVLDKARRLLEQLERDGMNLAVSPQMSTTTQAPSQTQLSLFQVPDQAILRELAHLDLDQLTPLEALNLLGQWKQLLPAGP